MSLLATSQSLLERLHDRTDDRAWQRLWTLYAPWLRGWLSQHALQPTDIEDVLQDILMVVSEKFPAFFHNGKPGAFRAWLRMILTHRVRHFLRGKRHRESVVVPGSLSDWLDQLEDGHSDLSQQWDQEHDRQIVRRLLASIQSEFNPTTWQIFQMLVLEDRPTAEVARHFQIKPNAVYVAKSRVLMKLREELRGLIDI